jgi:hypothetical protein
VHPKLKAKQQLTNQANRPVSGDKQKPREKAQNQYWVAVLMMFAGLFLVDLGMRPSQKIEAEFSSKIPSHTIADKHIKNTSRRIELEQEKTRIERKYAIPSVGQKLNFQSSGISSTSQIMGNNSGAPMDKDADQTRLLNDLAGRPTPMELQRPSEVLQAGVRERQDDQDFLLSERARFVADFVENAYQNGYEVKLDENLVVISVRPIRRHPAAGQSQSNGSFGKQ